MYNKDDICAIATGVTQSAIAIIRISGEPIFNKLNTLIQFHNSNLSIFSCKPNYLYRANFIYNNELIDDIMIVKFEAPKSYTGENMVELYIHGSIYIQQRILSILYEQDIRNAQPGEFSLRAYLNGKMDLTQAEAINDIITSVNYEAHKLALHQLRGGIRKEIENIRKNLMDLLVYIELELDFAEEDVEFANRQQLREILLRFIEKVRSLSFSYQYGNAIKNGVSVTIVGETNVGKSTLMNALLNDERSIVSSIPGTTRDIVEDTFNHKGILFRFADTAGIRKSHDTIEQIGVERALKKASESIIVILMLNAEDNIDKLTQQIDEWTQKINENQRLIIVLNKIDKLNVEEKKQIILKYLQKFNLTLIPISAKLRIGIQDLMDNLHKNVNSLNISGNEVVITNQRQYYLLLKALESAEKTLEALDMNLPNDLIAEELKAVNLYLSEIIGEIPSQEVLNQIFSRFCIGK